MSSPRRHASLLLLRRRDRENAIEALDEAVRESERIAAALEDIRSAISALGRRLDEAHFKGPSSGAALRMCMDNRRRIQRERRGCEEKERSLRRDEREAALRLGDARDAVAEAQKALTALEKEK